jgi:LemA protein
MDARERTDRMESEGLVTPLQARQLRSSIRLHARRRKIGRPARRSWPIYLAAFIAIIGATLIFIYSGEPQPPQVGNVSDTVHYTGAPGEMDRMIVSTIEIIVFLILPVMLLTVVYNRLINREEAVLKSWAQVESQFQRRADLIPPIVEMVMSSVPQERASMGEDTSQRLSAALHELTSDLEPLARLMSESELLIGDRSLLEQVTTLQADLSKDIAAFMAVSELLPELPSTQRYSELKTELKNANYRIGIARTRFNDAVRAHNKAIGRSLVSPIARLGNFQRKAGFESDDKT